MIRGGAFVAIKGVFGILATLMVSSVLSQEAFSLWIILLSIGVFITLSDLGLGQYIVVELVQIKEKHTNFDGLYNDDVVTVLLSRYAYLYLFLSFIFITIGIYYLVNFFEYPSLNNWEFTVFISLLLISIRLFFIPIMAAINAEGRYDERKKIEAYSYGFFLLYCVLGRSFNFHYSAYLILFQFILLIPSIYFFVQASKRGLSNDYFRGYQKISKSWAWNVLKKSITYFIISLSSYVTRIGIPVIAGLSLLNSEVAIIGQATVLFFQGGFQLVDLVVKLLQPNYKRYLNLKSKTFFLVFVMFLSLFVYLSSLLLDTFLDTFYYDKTIYILMATIFIIEASIFYTNSLLIMNKNNARAISIVMGVKTVFLLLIAVFTDYQYFCYSVIFLGLIYLIALNLSVFRRWIKLENSILL